MLIEHRAVVQILNFVRHVCYDYFCTIPYYCEYDNKLYIYIYIYIVLAFVSHFELVNFF